MHVTRECHMGIAEERVHRFRRAAALIEQNLSVLTAAAWEMHERRGRGMLVLRLDDVLAGRDENGESDIEEVGLPYLTEGEYEAKKPEIVLEQLRTYDPTAEIILASRIAEPLHRRDKPAAARRRRLQVPAELTLMLNGSQQPECGTKYRPPLGRT